MLPATRIQKADTTINVQIVDDQDVFRQYEDRRVNPGYGMSLNETFPYAFPTFMCICWYIENFTNPDAALGFPPLSDKQALSETSPAGYGHTPQLRLSNRRVANYLQSAWVLSLPSE